MGAEQLEKIFKEIDQSSTSSSSTVSSAALQVVIDRLKCQGRRQSTRTSYHGVWKTFNDFNVKLDKKPSTWEDRLTLFVGYLICKKLKSSTIKSYISAIRAVLAYIGIELNENRVLLTSLIKACKIHNDCIKTKLPIRKGLLTILIKAVDELYTTNPQPYLTAMYKALFSTMYFGLFRVGELTKSSHTVKAKDVHIGINKKKLMFILHSSKTHDEGNKPQVIKISAVSEVKDCKKSLVCPFQLLQNYVNIRKPYRTEEEQFFVMKDRSPVTAHHLRKTLKRLLKLNRLNSAIYTSSAFRAGRASDLLTMGVSVETIRKIGRWRSSAVYTYLKT